jgi:hypothetical protein
MRAVRTGASACAMALALSSYAAAEVTDVAVKANALLASLGPQTYTRIGIPSYQVTDDSGKTVTLPAGYCDQPSNAIAVAVCHQAKSVSTSVIDHSILTISNASFSFADQVTVGTPVTSSFPNSATSWTQNVINCTDSPGKSLVSISKQTQSTVSSTLTNQISSSAGNSKGFSFGVFGDASLQVSDTETTVSTRSASMGESGTRTGSGSIVVPPKSKIIAEFVVWPVIYDFPFSVNAIIDGDVSPNDHGWHRLSDIFPASQRTLQISGSVVVSQASDGNLKFLPGTLEPSDCLAGNTLRMTAPVQKTP